MTENPFEPLLKGLYKNAISSYQAKEFVQTHQLDGTEIDVHTEEITGRSEDVPVCPMDVILTLYDMLSPSSTREDGEAINASKHMRLLYEALRALSENRNVAIIFNRHVHSLSCAEEIIDEALEHIAANPIVDDTDVMKEVRQVVLDALRPAIEKAKRIHEINSAAAVNFKSGGEF